MPQQKRKNICPNTLIKAAVRALHAGDVSFRDCNNVLYEGMTEKLLQFCSDLFPELFQKELLPHYQEQVIEFIVSLENIEQKEDKELRFQTKIDNVFNSIRDDNRETTSTSI